MDAEAREALGVRGESWFQIHISQADPSGRPLFRATHLGSKWPTVDYLVEALDTDGKAAIFFAQVKNSGSASAGAIPVTLTDESIQRLAAMPIPTYLVGIEDVTGTSYILSMNGRGDPVSSVPRIHPINAENRERLWQEVVGFWEHVVTQPFTSFFTDPRTG
jgi:hypothetical protein